MSVIKSIAAFLCGLMLVQDGGSQVPNFGSCPEVKVVKNFNTEKYLGRWYENQRFFAFFESGNCISADYGTTDEKGVISVINTQYKDGKKSSVNGTAKFSDNSGDAKLTVSFSSSPFGGGGKYWVLGTDYDSYAVIWSCTDVIGVVNARFAWILTRERQPPSSVVEKAYAVFDENKINRSGLKVTDQTNCVD